jgi:hypothetical protein
MTIVIAWTEEGQKHVGTRIARYGELIQQFAPTTLAHAVVWLNNGTDNDLLKARKYVASEYPTGKVFTFTNEQDPLGVARAKILEGKLV